MTLPLKILSPNTASGRHAVIEQADDAAATRLVSSVTVKRGACREVAGRDRDATAVSPTPIVPGVALPTPDGLVVTPSTLMLMVMSPVLVEADV